MRYRYMRMFYDAYREKGLRKLSADDLDDFFSMKQRNAPSSYIMTGIFSAGVPVLLVTRYIVC